MFDSLKYAKVLEEAGVPREQAEVHVYLIKDVIGEEMVTKKDLETGLNSLQLEMTSQFGRELDKVRHDMLNLEHRMTIKLGTLMAAFLATGLTIAKFIFV